jgi:PKD repeat protein
MKYKFLLILMMTSLLLGCKKEDPESLPIAKFAFSVNNKTVTFTNQSMHAQSYYWDFGDGTATSEANPVKTYSNTGTYKVTLTAKNVTKTNSCSHSINVTQPNPQAAFSYYTNGLQVSFTNQSTNAQSYLWNFGNGQTSTQQNPSITYGSAGTYTVKLTAYNGDLSHTATKSITVASKQPTASFTYKTEAPLKVVLTNTSTNATSYEWDFGDGTSSTEKNPTHRYSAVGSYIITLVAKNSAGSSNQYRETIKISAPKVFVTGISYRTVGKEGKYYRSVCKDDDLLTNTWWSTSYTPMLTSSNLPYTYTFSSPKEFTGIDGDTYYTVYVYWNNTTSGDGTQILKQKMYTSEIKTYPEYIDIFNDNVDTWIKVHFSYQ